MSDDPDFPKANHALKVLRQARLSRNETAAIMVGDLVYEMASTGLRTPEIVGVIVEPDLQVRSYEGPGPGSKRKCLGWRCTSVLPSGADIVSPPRHDRFVPISDIAAVI